MPNLAIVSSLGWVQEPQFGRNLRHFVGFCLAGTTVHTGQGQIWPRNRDCMSTVRYYIWPIGPDKQRWLVQESPNFTISLNIDISTDFSPAVMTVYQTKIWNRATQCNCN